MKQEFPGQREDEKLLLTFRRHIFALRKGVLVLIVVSLVGFVPLMISPNNSSLTWFGVAGIVIGCLAFFYHWIGWYFTVYIVTDQRLRQQRQRGLFNSSITEIAWDKVQVIPNVQRGVMSSLFNYGIIVIQTYVGDLVITMVPDATHVADVMREQYYRRAGKEPEDYERQD